MKKVFTVLITFFLIIGTFIPAAFASNSYDLDELYMSIDIPSDFMVFTKDISNDDPNLDKIGMDKETLSQQFTENNIYLDAIKIDPSTQIIITMTENSGTNYIFDLSLYSDEEKKDLAEGEQQADTLNQVGAQYTGYDFYEHGQASFICFDIASSNSETALNSKQYFTIINGQAISIILYSYDGAVTSEQEDTLKSVVDSITFSEVKEKPGNSLSLSILVISIIAAIVAILVFGIRKAIKKRKKKRRNRH
ncbi:MAG: hypothetical protein R2876_03895 [Eubacteriales bacterium]